MRDDSSSRPYLPTQMFSGSCVLACFLLLLVIRILDAEEPQKITETNSLYFESLRSEASVSQEKKNYEFYRNETKKELESKFNSYEHISKPTIMSYIWRMFYFSKV